MLWLQLLEVLASDFARLSPVLVVREGIVVNNNKDHVHFNFLYQILIQSNPNLPCPDLPGTPIYRGHTLSPYKVHSQVFSVKQNPYLPVSPISRVIFFPQTTPVNDA